MPFRYTTSLAKLGFPMGAAYEVSSEGTLCLQPSFQLPTAGTTAFWGGCARGGSGWIRAMISYPKEWCCAATGCSGR